MNKPAAVLVLACAVLLYTTNWLLGKMDSGKWAAYIRGKVGDALTSGNSAALGLVSFLAVYREGFETVLFYKALAIGSNDIVDRLMGFIAGAVVLAVLFAAIILIEARLPLNIVFGLTSATLFLLSLKFAGIGVHGLQEAGIIRQTAWGALPKIGGLGIYPTVETLGLQALISVLGAALLYMHFRPRPKGWMAV